MTIHPIAKWVIKQTFGVVRGIRIVAILEALRAEDVDALERLLPILQRRSVFEILDDLILLEQIDRIIHHDPTEDRP